MNTSALLKKVRQIEIKTKGLSNHIFAGEYHTAFKGRGMAFSEVREYEPGDDIRTIDWNVTARYNTPFVKVFEEEREMTVMMLIDVSASGSFYKLGIKKMIPGFNEQLKILTDEGVDLIILEAMSSQADIVQAMIECSTKINMPVWLSVSCVIDDSTNKVMLGYNDSMDAPPEVYENFEKSLDKFSKLHQGPILIAHSNINVTGRAIKIVKKNFNGVVGAYPNVGFYKKPNWIYEDNMRPEDYLKEAKSWVKNGSQIIGGCCGIGPDLIKSLSKLKL